MNLSDGNASYEFFPGVYPKGVSFSAGSQVYLNPGVYTIGGSGFSSTNAATMCVYGAPACDELAGTIPGYSSANCSSASFTSGDASYVPSATWYYYCSPWGTWDSKLAAQAPGGTLAAPTFTDGTTPLDGVTFYMVNNGNNSFQLTGGGTMYMAAPNLCPGTGALSETSVPYPAGASTGSYTYPTGSVAGAGNTASASQVYPSADFTLAGECTQSPARNVWSGEFPTYQHLHFLIFARSPNTSTQLTNNTRQNFWGVVYNPGNSDTGGGCGGGCAFSVTGSAVPPVGPPLVTGQVIQDNISFTGSGNLEIFYRGCTAGPTPCGSGVGTGLVE